MTRLAEAGPGLGTRGDPRSSDEPSIADDGPNRKANRAAPAASEQRPTCHRSQQGRRDGQERGGGSAVRRTWHLRSAQRMCLAVAADG